MRSASRRIRSTLSSIADSATSPLPTAATSASPHGPCGPGMTTSSPALADAAVERVANQSETTTPSNPSSSFSTPVISGSLSVMLTPSTEL